MLICGVDEAGRGPLVGAVFAAAVILDPTQMIEGLADSKKLSEKRREQLEIEIKARSLAWAIAYANAEEVDRLNILQATLLAMQRAIAALAIRPTRALIDGNRCPRLEIDAQAIIKGDATVPEISAASILAKTARDARIWFRPAQRVFDAGSPGSLAAIWRVPRTQTELFTRRPRS
jgi:ribonuclease HII